MDTTYCISEGRGEWVVFDTATGERVTSLYTLGWAYGWVRRQYGKTWEVRR
jgi:hypothetical protein